MGQKNITIASGMNPFDKNRSAAAGIFSPPANESKDVTPSEKETRQHIHLILPNRQAEIIKMLAKSSGVSLNQFMSSWIENMYQREWSPLVEQIELTQKKLGLKPPKINKNVPGL